MIRTTLVAFLSGVVALGCSSPSASPSDGGGDVSVEKSAPEVPGGSGGTSGAAGGGPGGGGGGGAAGTCPTPTSFSCFRYTQPDAGLVRCSGPDEAVQAICFESTWMCPPGFIRVASCACFTAGTATAACPGGGGGDAGDAHASDAGDAVSEAPRDTSSDAVCADVGCELDRVSGTFCKLDEVQWICHGPNADLSTFQHNCRDAATNAVRYCCPPSFRSMCQGG